MSDDLTLREALILAGVPRAAPDLEIMDPDHPGFVPLAERSPREQARFLVLRKLHKPRHRAVLTRSEERSEGSVPRFLTRLVWAGEDS